MQENNKMIGYIYKFENKINRKIYIGKTKNIKERIYQHSHVTKNKNTKFGNALRKYGINMFDFNILVTIHSKSSDNLDIILNCLEKYFIKKYNSFNNGYNCTLGGDGTINFKHSEETKNKLRGRIVSEETRKKIRHALKGKPCHRRLTDKWRSSVIEAKSIPIKQFSKDGIFIKQWSSITKAARFYNLPISCISRVCKNERKSCGGFIWKYCKTK